MMPCDKCKVITFYSPSGTKTCKYYCIEYIRWVDETS